MTSTRRTAALAGAFFLLTEVSAIAGRALYAPAVSDSAAFPGDDSAILLGIMFETILVVSVVGTAVILYPILKRQNAALAIAYFGARVLEAAIILVGIVSILTVVTLRQDLAGSEGADPTAIASVSSALVAMHGWTTVFGPGFALGAGSLLLASLMYSSRLVPRPIAILGLVGGALITVSAAATVFGLWEQMSTLGLVAALPVFAWEVSLAFWLIVRGFTPGPLTADVVAAPEVAGRARSAR